MLEQATLLILVGCLWAILTVELVAGGQEIRSSSTETWRVTWRQERHFRNRLVYGLSDSSHVESSSEETLFDFRSYLIRSYTANSIPQQRKRGRKRPPPVPHVNRPTDVVAYVDDCNPSPCENDGICFNNGNSFLCLCISPYKGENCQRIDLCTSNPCNHGGKCIQKGNNYTCRCPQQYLGNLCELRDPCQPNPCQNDGTCLLKDGAIQCQCSQEYIGEFCEMINPCLPNPCANNSLCIITMDTTAQCQCPDYLMGVFCQLKNPCSPNPCKNNGRCRISGQSFSCECERPYTGQMCELIAMLQNNEVFYPCVSEPCHNGGVCTVVEGDIHCQCYPTYTGPFCEIQVDFPRKIGPKLVELMFLSGIDVAKLMSTSTFFAPTENALLNTPEGFLEDLSSDRKALIDFILYHTVPSVFPAADILDNDGKIVVPIESDMSHPRAVSKLSKIQTRLDQVCGRVIDSDEYEGKGSILIVNKVLIAPTKHIMEVLTTDHRFTRFFEYVQHMTHILQILNDKRAVTVLVPTNSAINALPKVITEDRRSMRRVILYHIIIDYVCFPDVHADDSNRYREVVKYTETQDVVILQAINGNKFVNDVRVIESDIVARNGVIHYIENILDPSYVKS